MPESDVLVVGYPRSGNTWLSCLLGDALDSPVTGWGQARPLATEGQERTGPYTVRQLHLRPGHEIAAGGAIHDAWTFAPRRYDGERILLIVRDPRDVAASVRHYWDLDGLETAIRAMGEGLHPLVGVGPWVKFYECWNYGRMDRKMRLFTLHYEEMFAHPRAALFSILYFLDLPILAEEAVEAALARQSFATRRAEIAGSGDRYMYGETVQLKSMRKGVAGDWHNHFTPALNRLAWEYFGPAMGLFGYRQEENFQEVQYA